jgi:hypothetical protein
MNTIELYKVWAPEASIWSNWVKPVLFAEVPVGPSWLPTPDWRSFTRAWFPAIDARTAVVLDLPDSNAIWLGMALALRGFRPIPLYNGASGSYALIDVGPIVGALQTGGMELAGLPIESNAPPVFLLDANRWAGASLVTPGKFDNRWATFPQDFPSANFLIANGIRSVLLGQVSNGQPQRDLSHILLRWQEAGIQIFSCNVHDDLPPEPLQVSKPSSFRRLWYRAMVLAGLRRNSAGGFGAVVPEPSQSGGFG